MKKMIMREAYEAWNLTDSKLSLGMSETVHLKSDVWLNVYRNSMWIRKTN